MKPVKKYLQFFGLAFFLAAWLAGAVQGFSQELSISAAATPRQASEGQNIRLVVTIEGKANLNESPQLPELGDFQVYSGGRSSNFSFINGQVSSSLSFTYILVPKRPGSFTIGPIQISHGGKVYSTQPIQIEVGGGSARRGPVSSGNGAGAVRSRSAERPAGHAGEAVFITTQADRPEVYLNEPVTLTFRFYSRIPILSQPQYQPPDTSGFWTEDLPPQREYVAPLDGYDYRVIEIKTALFPTAAGQLTVGPATLVVQVQDFQRQGGDPFMDDFFRDFFSSGQQVALHSKPLTIRVKPVPVQGQPPDFSGTVGHWSLSAKLDRKEAKVGEAVTLEIRIFGEGNVKSVGKPVLPALTGFKVYDTLSSSDVQKQNSRVQGVKIYRTLIRPEVTGELSIPSIAYSYFDPDRKKYERIQVPVLRLKVLPGGGQPFPSGVGESPEPAAASAGSGVKVLAQDIRYLKSGPMLQKSGEGISGFWIGLGFVFPALGVLALWAWRRHEDRLAADPRFARKLSAERSARQTLRQAHLARVHRDAKRFYTALSAALTGFAADSLGESRSGITQRELLAKLTERGAEAGLTQALAGLWDECDFARFAPAEREAEEMANHEQAAEALLIQLGRLLSRGRKA